MYTDLKSRKVGAITSEELRNYIMWMLMEKRKWEGHAHKAEENMTVGLSPVAVIRI
jgi:integrase/recombinase XerD